MFSREGWLLKWDPVYGVHEVHGGILAFLGLLSFVDLPPSLSTHLSIDGDYVMSVGRARESWI